ncbi:MAG: UDP-N-acetylmuramate:L-alanyl-gamma-D-glutamyl-meso-diaminopimelate ligase [Acidobacteriota bacterium]
MLKPGDSIHLLGVCGTAMGTFAAMLAEKGYRVTGSDQGVYPPMSDLLAAKGIDIASPYSPDNLEPRPDVVVVGNAIPRGNPELEAVLDGGLRYRSFPELLRELFLDDAHPVVITGTHGKTTTTAMTGVALMAAGEDPSVLVGGHVHDLDGSHRLGSGEAFVLEGDEYDTAYFDKSPKFLHYFPKTLVINNLEFDHADIFDSLEALELQFRRLVRVVPRSGRILLGDASEAAARVVAEAPAPIERFGLADDSDWQAVDLRDGDDGPSFELRHRGETLGRIQIPLSGEHNIRNAVAAAAIAIGRGGDFDAVAKGLGAMRGVKRRLEVRGEAGGVLVYDDFAHHPTAIEATLKALRTKHEGRRIWGLFEPRSWTSRRKVHQAALQDALAAADLSVIAPVYQPERLPAEIRLEPTEVAEGLRGAGRQSWAPDGVDAIVDIVGEHAKEGDVVAVMSNGSFDGIHGRLLERLGG